MPLPLDADSEPPNTFSRRSRRPWSVRTLLVWLVLACFLPGLAGTVFLLLQEYQEGRAQLQRNTLQTTRALVQTVDAQLHLAQNAAQALATSESLARQDFAAFYRRAQALLHASDIGQYVVISTENGEPLVNTLRPLGAPVSAHANLEQLRRVFATGRPVVSDVFLSSFTGSPVVSIEVPVRSGGKVVFALSMVIPVQSLSDILSRQNLPRDWVAVVFDSTGTIAARTHLSERFVGQMGVPELLQQLQKAFDGTFEVTLKEGVPTLASFSRSRMSGWSVVIGTPRQSLEAQLVRTVALLSLGAVLVFGLSIGLAWFVGGRIARSVRALSAFARALAADGERVAMPRVHLRETQQVAQAMAQASALSNERKAALLVLNENLRLAQADLQNKVEVAEAATRAKRVFLDVMSHELRTPLNAIIGFSGTLLMRISGPLTPTQEKQLDHIKMSGKHLLAIVNDVLDFSRIESGRFELIPAAFEPHQFLEECAAQFAPAAQAKGLELTVDWRGPKGQRYWADLNGLRQALSNLVNNALKFTERGFVRVEACEVERHDKASVLEFAVTDSGIGIPADKQTLLFQPFLQVDSSSTRAYGGTGLGLCIVRSLANLMGGEVGVESAAGQGSRFWFRIRADLQPELQGER